jgi:hypothetical protein
MVMAMLILLLLLSSIWYVFDVDDAVSPGCVVRRVAFDDLNYPHVYYHLQDSHPGIFS